jgi:hypothetical protein
MIARILLIAAFVTASVAACGGSHPPTSANQTGSGSTGTTGSGASSTGGGGGSNNGTVTGEGQVCGYGSRSAMANAQAPACPAGLKCCYPCGIEGCDSVCMADCGPPRP